MLELSLSYNGSLNCGLELISPHILCPFEFNYDINVFKNRKSHAESAFIKAKYFAKTSRVVFQQEGKDCHFFRY